MKKYLVVLGSLLIASPVAAQTFGDLVSNTQENVVGPGADLVLNIAWISGLIMLLVAAFAFFKSGRQHGQGLEGGKIVALLAGGAMLVAFPTYVGVGPASIFGADGDTSSSAGQLRSLGD